MRPLRRCTENYRKRTRLFGLRFYLGLLVLGEITAAVFIAVLVDAAIRKHTQISLLWECLLLAAVSFVMASAMELLINAFILKPVKKLRIAMNEVADGNYDVRMNTNSSIRDISRLNESFNLMAEELSKTEILQTDFVASVSHEIKTPVAAIKGFTEILQDKNLSSEEHDAVLNRIIANSDRLSHLVSSVLLLSRIENGAQRKQCVNYRLDEQIRQAFLMFENEWEKKNIEFDIELEDIEYNGDGAMLMHVWLNLISNAVKFTPENGNIGMYLNRFGSKIRFIIEDSGPGFAPGIEKHIFEKFYQGDSSHKREGNGLGLALVKNILDRNNGSVTAENLPEGGARFTVDLQI